MWRMDSRKSYEKDTRPTVTPCKAYTNVECLAKPPMWRHGPGGPAYALPHNRRMNYEALNAW
jgi:hypothetical protein